MNGSDGGSNGQGDGRGRLDRAANNALFTLVSRAALIVLVGLATWAAPRIWDNMAETARLLDRATWRLDLHDNRLNGLDTKTERLERRLRGVERATPPVYDPWPGPRDGDNP